MALATAAIHLYMELSWGNTLFTLNGLGYLWLLAALQLPIPQLRRFRGDALATNRTQPIISSSTSYGSRPLSLAA